ncbi:hypothetical protein ACFZDK_01660 [Streptomyces sp. NPDC007901]|uniref:hypothetical protein n=1 Tax=Streptomyces sp. NPDC007901 TaxID=3364785 RepID=UPI0036E87BE9
MSARRRTVLGAGLAAAPVLSSGVAGAGGDGARRAAGLGAYVSWGNIRKYPSPREPRGGG